VAARSSGAISRRCRSRGPARAAALVGQRAIEADVVAPAAGTPSRRARRLRKDPAAAPWPR
jgi:hypothetical protein